MSTEVPEQRSTTQELVRVVHPHGQADGSVEGYRAGRTLPLRVELGRQLGRRRTRATLGFLAALPLLLLAAFEIGHGSAGRSHELVDVATASGLNFTAFTVLASTDFLFVVMVALFFGDVVASEASWSTLKYLLAAPVPRARLLRQKAAVSAILSVLGLVLVTAVALAAGVFWYGSGELLGPSGEALPFGTGVARLAGANAYLALHLSWIAGLALLLSVAVDTPLGAVGAAVVVSILSQILDRITALGAWRDYLPTHYSTAWQDLLVGHVDWTALANGAFSGVAYGAVFAVLAVRRFVTKDILS